MKDVCIKLVTENKSTAGNGTPVLSELVHHCHFKATLQVRLMYRRMIYENTNLCDG